jgi:CheY-like chemotaxis protein
MLLTLAENHSSYSILKNRVSLFGYLYSNSGYDCHHQHYLSKPSSYSLTDPSYLRSQGPRVDTIIETETKEQLQPPFIKRILVVDDDPDLTFTFKAGLDGHYYGDGDKKRRFEVYTYNDPLLAVQEFKPHFYDVLITDVYMPNMSGFELCEKVLELDVNIRVCFMTAFLVNIRALREVYTNVSFGCFIEKPVSIKYLIERLAAELD